MVARLFFRTSVRFALLAMCAAPGAALSASPKIDKETCEQLQAEQARFAQSGIMADIEKGADWGKSNLSPDRLREVEHFIMLDEQLKFGCRVVTLTEDAKKALEAAKRLELSPNEDPTLPPKPPEKPEQKSSKQRDETPPQRSEGKPAKPAKKTITPPEPDADGPEGNLRVRSNKAAAAPAKQQEIPPPPIVVTPSKLPDVPPTTSSDMPMPLFSTPAVVLPAPSDPALSDNEGHKDAYNPHVERPKAFAPPAFVE